MNEDFFETFGNFAFDEDESRTISDLEKFNEFLPDLDNACYQGDGSDGVCFSQNVRVYKFGFWNDWRSHVCDFVSNVSSTEELMFRMEKLLETQESCLPEVYRLVTLDHEFYFIEMEYLPYSPDCMASIADRSLLWACNQYTGESCFDLTYVSPTWRDWAESYERLQALGFYHRDLRSYNIRCDKDMRVKFIDLESFVFFIGKDELDQVA
jgi:hypothetical protein